MTYPLCDRIVTLYRKNGDQVERYVLEDCYYRFTDVLEEGRFLRKFLLVRPGAFPIRPGDRVLEGIGPEKVDWETFLPVNVPGLSQAEYAIPNYWLGQLIHWEAGRK